VHPVESLNAEVIDYDFNTDVGLIRIRPDRKLAATLVVPENWKPTQGQGMTTVGCSEGNDATAWSTVITNPRFQGLVGKTKYTAIECQHAPKQGRSGGGLYTLEGYLAGVCNFAEPRGKHGLYASPDSIYRMLDRNQLTICYRQDAAVPGRLIAANAPRAPRSSGTMVRAQSPNDATIPMPAPETIGINLDQAGNSRPVSGSASNWQTPTERLAAASTRAARRPVSYLGEADPLLPEEPSTPVTTDLQMNPAVAGVGERESQPAGSAVPDSEEAAGESEGGWRTSRRTPVFETSR
jgi:hypothetical protein